MSLSKELVKATNEGCLYEFIANHYTEMTTYQLKEVLLSILGVVYDNCGTGAIKDEEYEAFQKLVVNELAVREFGED